MNCSGRQHADGVSTLVSVPIADVLSCTSNSRNKPREPMKNVLLYVDVKQQASKLEAIASICVNGSRAREEWAGLRIDIAVGASCTSVPLREVLSAAVDQMPSLEYVARFAGLDQSDLLPIELRLCRSHSTEFPGCRCS